MQYDIRLISLNFYMKQWSIMEINVPSLTAQFLLKAIFAIIVSHLIMLLTKKLILE